MDDKLEQLKVMRKRHRQEMLLLNYSHYEYRCDQFLIEDIYDDKIIIPKSSPLYKQLLSEAFDEVKGINFNLLTKMRNQLDDC